MPGPETIALFLLSAPALNLTPGPAFWAKVQRWLSSAVIIGLGVRLALSERS